MSIVPHNYASNNPCYKCGKGERHQNSSYCRECLLANRKGYYKKNYDQAKQRDNHLRAKFRITQEDYDLMFLRQGGCCAVCGKQETKIHPWTGKVWPLCVDHNHETGEVRELLCFTCNALLGRVERDRELVKKLVKYLKRHDT